ncbi:MAG: hypothetical protein HWE13_08595 [Gammaproteobacteria bacterium]|nr:hypothetical protein [Gammaproteobacteria bacterium]NVK88172.1 hypothetical protein [Gammaproteobacteria bacterium]
MKVRFQRPPKLCILLYIVGFAIIVPTFVHQNFGGQILSEQLNLQLFIGGAIIVAIGSVFNWLIPLWSQNKSSTPK